MHAPTIKPNLDITLHADESVSFWNPIAQRWERTCDDFRVSPMF